MASDEPIIRAWPDAVYHRSQLTPGIYTQIDARQFCVLPILDAERHEMIPFSWAAAMPEVSQFVEAFPEHWEAHPERELWRSRLPAEYEHGEYWCKYDPRRPR